jgi:hypothetical protein
MVHGGAITLNIVRTSQNTVSGCPSKRKVLKQREQSETGGSRRKNHEHLHRRKNPWEGHMQLRRQ